VIEIETLPGSPLPAELRAAGYELKAAEEGERILPSAIVERLTMTSSGALVPIAVGSTAAVSEVRRHAGITRVERWALPLGEPISLPSALIQRVL
jgi:hypothetical protein